MMSPFLPTRSTSARKITLTGPPPHRWRTSEDRAVRLRRTKRRPWVRSPAARSLDLGLLQGVDLAVGAVGPAGQLLDEDLAALLAVGVDLDRLGLDRLEPRGLGF